MLFTGSGPLVILTSHSTVTESALLAELAAKGITKVIAHELSVDIARERYGGHFSVFVNDLRQTDGPRVLDYSGRRAFEQFRLDELGPPLPVSPVCSFTDGPDTARSCFSLRDAVLGRVILLAIEVR